MKKRSLGDIAYVGTNFGTPFFGHLAKVKIVKDWAKENRYVFKVLENYCDIIAKPKSPKVNTGSQFYSEFFDTFDEAKNYFIKDMELNKDKDIIHLLFTRDRRNY